MTISGQTSAAHEDRPTGRGDDITRLLLFFFLFAFFSFVGVPFFLKRQQLAQ